MSTTILKRLTEMADRLGLTSQQIMLIYAANSGWTNHEMTAAAVNVLQKIAGDNKIDLYDEDPFIVQLIAQGVILPSEASCFGWLLKERNGKTEIRDTGRSGGDDSGTANGTAAADKPAGGCY